MDAGCSLEDSCPPDQFAAFRAAHPDHIALTYINCSAAVKAQSDIIVTSSSADASSARSRRTRRSSSAPTGTSAAIWPAHRARHAAVARHLHRPPGLQRNRAAEAQGAVSGRPGRRHPECPPHIIDHADHVGSTRSILDFATASPADVILVATEPHIIHQMEKAAPAQDLHRGPRRRRQLQLQHVPLHGAEHAGEALRRPPRPRAPDRARPRADGPRPRAAERMLEMAGRTVGPRATSAARSSPSAKNLRRAADAIFRHSGRSRSPRRSRAWTGTHYLARTFFIRSVDRWTPAFLKEVAAYRQPRTGGACSNWRSPLLPFALLWAATWALLRRGLSGRLLLTIPAGGFLLRLFLIQHDCGHGAFFAASRRNDWVGRCSAC
jgi:hypothetical protein